MKELTTESTEITEREFVGLDVITERVLGELAGLLKRTQRKRGALDCDMKALGVITEEYHEVREAIQRGEVWKVLAELLDLANGCIRRVLTIDAGADLTTEAHGKGTDEEGELAQIVAQLDRLVGNLQEQDNRITAVPVFCVMQKRRVYGIRRGYSDDVEREFDEGTQRWRLVRYVEVDEFVTACLTEKGCEDYLKLNGHNLTAPFIYVFGGKRNLEWEFLRSALPVMLEALKGMEAAHV